MGVKVQRESPNTNRNYARRGRIQTTKKCKHTVVINMFNIVLRAYVSIFLFN